MNFRRRICSFIGLALSAMLVGGCVENDLPYPSVTVNIAAIKGEGFTVKELDVVNRSLVLTLDERTDIRNVRIDSIAYAIVPHNVSVNLDLDGALGDITSSVAFPGTFDLRESLRAKLSLFEDFEWTITAEQTIDRRFRVAGQVGFRRQKPYCYCPRRQECRLFARHHRGVAAGARRRRRRYGDGLLSDVGRVDQAEFQRIADVFR